MGQRETFAVLVLCALAGFKTSHSSQQPHEETSRSAVSQPHPAAPTAKATPFPIRKFFYPGSQRRVLNLPSQDGRQLELELDAFEVDDVSSELDELEDEQIPAPVTQSGPSDQKYEVSLGPCVFQVNEPCKDNHKIIFYLFRHVDQRPAVLSVSDPKLPEIFDPLLPTKVLIHGYAGSVDFNFTASIRQAYLLRGGYNVIVVDWGELTKLPCYPSSVVNTLQVARCTGQLLADLGRKTPSLAPQYLHAVGFSLGAHIAAYLSAELQARTGRRLGRITGLDPALPAFASLSLSWKLDPEDAEFVDVVHTNAGVFGKVEPTGDVDFYVNGGSVQPFCAHGDRNVPLCSHLLAPVYFSETILNEQSFWGRQCSSFGHYAWGLCPTPPPDQVANTPGTFMGEGVDSRVRGTFIVETADSYPFGLGPPQPLPPPPAPPQPPDTVLILLGRNKYSF